MGRFTFMLWKVFTFAHCILVYDISAQLLCTSLLLFILADVIHMDKINGYRIFAHDPKAKDISDAIRELLATKTTNVKVKLPSSKQHNLEEADFEKRCTTYFEENFENLAAEAPLILPCKEPEKFKEIVNTMEHWCRKTNESSNIKGLVLHSFFVFQHLVHFGFTSKALKDSLKIEVFSKEPVIVVYNPQENALLLIRNAENQELTTDIKLGLDDIKMFILSFHDNLKYSNLKLISLVVTDKAHDVKLTCPTCINNVLSMEEFKDVSAFENWFEERATYFETESLENINCNFIKSFLAKITGTVAATFIYGKHIPTMIDRSNEKMTNLAVLLTRKQMKILHSQDKHIIIKGGFGCGKTVIAVAMFKKILESLKNDEKLYYICFDARSELLDDMTEGIQKADDANVALLHNKEGRNLSEIMKDILEKKESTEKVNFFVDEYDGESLGESEAENLNELFNESLKQMFIILIVQPIEKKRVINDIVQNTNRFDLLENMKLFELNRVMRNSVEIHSLVKLTKDVIQKETIFVHNLIKKKAENFRTILRLTKNIKSRVFRTTLPKPPSDITTKLPSRMKDPHEYPKEKLELDEVKAVQGSVKMTHDGDTHKYPKENPTIPKLGLDEAQALSGLTQTTGNKGVRTVSKFLFAAADKTGHKITSEKPLLFEIWDRSDFQKIQSLIAIFQKRQIKKGEQVVLHFDTGANEIPENFLFIFEHHFKIQRKVTKNYKEFKSQKNAILVCSYPTFRGLEHPKITVIIDCDMYYVQHHLVETLARCTSDLCIVVLQNSKTLTNVTAEWKTKQVIQQWDVKFTVDPSQEENSEFEFTANKNPHIIKAKFSPEYCKQLEKKFAELVTEDENSELKRKEARKITQQR